MRSKQAPKRTVAPDPVYHNVLVTKLINRVMLSGKKTTSAKQVYQALDIIKAKTNQDPLQVLVTTVDNIKPQMEVRPRRIGGAAYQVPIPVRGSRQEALALRWLILAARTRPSSEHHTFAEKLATEVLDALNNAGGAIKKKLDSHRMAEANKAFAHFRW